MLLGEEAAGLETVRDVAEICVRYGRYKGDTGQEAAGLETVLCCPALTLTRTLTLTDP